MVASQCLIGPAPHGWEKAEVHLGSGNGLLNETLEGDRLELWVYIGGGGGHTIHIKSSVMRLRYTTPEESNVRHLRREEMKKKVQEHTEGPRITDDQISSSSDWEPQGEGHVARFS